jgi:K+-transporting ATPase ATPase C chain
MLIHLRPALVLLAASSLLTGVAYPLAVTGLAQLAMPKQANGSLIVEQGAVRGSALIGQSFSSPRYFHGRPSAAGGGYDAGASSGSNLGPTSAKLKGQIAERLAALKAENPGTTVPPELLTASASGLDPHLSPAAAAFQAPRIANTRGLTVDAVHALIVEHTTPRALGFLGEPVVNVLALNRALDATAR